MKIETFGPRQHPLTSYWPENSKFKGKLSPAGLSFFNSRLIGMPATHAVVAHDAEGNIIGYMRFTLSAGGSLHAKGTWVAPKWRKKKVAFDLWVFAIRTFKPKKVRVFTISRGGHSLIRALIAADIFQTIKWVHEV